MVTILGIKASEAITTNIASCLDSRTVINWAESGLADQGVSSQQTPENRPLPLKVYIDCLTLPCAGALVCVC
jgi:hypothetical protein